jgi:hypothetical protein
MKKYLLMLLGCVVWMPTAEACAISSVSENNLQMRAQYRSQTATSFSVRCDRSYNIKFSSRNLKDNYGRSFVSNGRDRINTQMSIRGARQNLWNTPISGGVSTLGQKYIIVVQLNEQPSVSTPAGMYTDDLYVSLSF